MLTAPSGWCPLVSVSGHFDALVDRKHKEMSQTRITNHHAMTTKALHQAVVNFITMKFTIVAP
jgi:hypothetical protein